MTLVLIGIFTLVSCEIFLRLPFAKCVQDVLSNSRKAGRVFRSKHISAEWKGRVMPVYSLRMGLGSARLFLLLLGVICPFLVLGLFVEVGAAEVSRLLTRPGIVVGMILLATAYMVLRNKMAWNRTTP